MVDSWVLLLPIIKLNLETGTFRVPISRADKVDIDVKNKAFLPTLLSAEYEAMFHMKVEECNGLFKKYFGKDLDYVSKNMKMWTN